MALGSSGKRYPNTSNRNRRPGLGTSNQRGRRTPISIVTVTPGDTTSVVFDQAVILKGIPAYPNNVGHLPTAAVLTDAMTLSLTYPTPDTTTTITVPFEEPAVRNGAGGYLLPGTFPGA